MTCIIIPTPEELNNLLEYKPKITSQFWLDRSASLFKSEALCRSWNDKWSGKEAFTRINTRGYLVGCVHNQSHISHRVIWAMVTGKWPILEIDHINHVKNDNRIINLREVTHTVNSKNLPIRHDNTSGIVGVSWHPVREKWHTRIRVNNTCIHLGYFNDLDMAAESRKLAEIKYGFHKNHGT